MQNILQPHNGSNWGNLKKNTVLIIAKCLFKDNLNNSAKFAEQKKLAYAKLRLKNETG